MSTVKSHTHTHVNSKVTHPMHSKVTHPINKIKSHINNKVAHSNIYKITYPLIYNAIIHPPLIIYNQVPLPICTTQLPTLLSTTKSPFTLSMLIVPSIWWLSTFCFVIYLMMMGKCDHLDLVCFWIRIVSGLGFSTPL